VSESGTTARVESIADTLERVLDKLDAMDTRARDFELAITRELAGLRAEVANVRSLIDGMHSRVGAVEARVEALELAAAEQRGAHKASKRKTIGLAAAGGGGIAGVVEALRAILGS